MTNITRKEMMNELNVNEENFLAEYNSTRKEIRKIFMSELRKEKVFEDNTTSYKQCYKNAILRIRKIETKLLTKHINQLIMDTIETFGL